MKKLTLLTITAFLAITALGQNTFPSSGNVGIGTTNPQYANLEVRNADNTQYAGYFYTSATGNGDHAPLLVNQSSGSSVDKILRVRSNTIDRFTIIGNGIVQHI